MQTSKAFAYLAVLLLIGSGLVSHAVADDALQYVQDSQFEDRTKLWMKAGDGECGVEGFKATLPDGTETKAVRLTPGACEHPWGVNWVNVLKGKVVPTQRFNLTFWARSPEKCKITISVQPMPGSDEKIWIADEVLPTEWKKYDYTFVSSIPATDGLARLQYTIGHNVGTIELAQPSLLSTPPATP